MIAGAICFVVPSIPFFTRERVADVGFFAIDVNKPHTILLNPGVGIALLVVGAVLFLTSGKRASSA
jgi:hypothetical protein